jgi:hypothetical protein
MASLISSTKYILKQKRYNTRKMTDGLWSFIQSSIQAPVSSLVKFGDPASMSPKLDQSTYTLLQMSRYLNTKFHSSEEFSPVPLSLLPNTSPTFGHLVSSAFKTVLKNTTFQGQDWSGPVLSRVSEHQLSVGPDGQSYSRFRTALPIWPNSQLMFYRIFYKGNADRPNSEWHRTWYTITRIPQNGSTRLFHE